MVVENLRSTVNGMYVVGGPVVDNACKSDDAEGEGVEFRELMLCDQWVDARAIRGRLNLASRAPISSTDGVACLSLRSTSVLAKPERPAQR